MLGADVNASAGVNMYADFDMHGDMDVDVGVIMNVDLYMDVDMSRMVYIAVDVIVYKKEQNADAVVCTFFLCFFFL